MNVENRVYPDADQLTVLLEPGPDGPIVMVNLLKYRERAAYPDGRAEAISGREAYHRYGVEVEKLVRDLGGRVLYTGDVTFLMLGRVDSLWDEVALVEYPSRAALLAMTRSPAYRALAVHRDAGLEGQLNIETVPTPDRPPVPAR